MPDSPDRPLVDIGLNLTHRRFDADREAVIERARQAGVGWMILTGVDELGSRDAAGLAASAPDRFRATAGVHPHHAADWNADLARRIEGLANAPTTVAVGETGLDFNRDFSPRPAQEAAFRAQLELAVRHRLPVFLHQRDAGERFLAILREYRDDLVAAVLHCFTDDRDMLHACLDLDLHIGVTGWVCDDRRGEALRACVADIPADRLMIETDAPFLTPRGLRPKPKGGRNEPAFLPHVAGAVAGLRGVSVDTLAAGTGAVARRFFNLPA